MEFQIIRFVISTFTPIFYIEISFVLLPPPPSPVSVYIDLYPPPTAPDCLTFIPELMGVVAIGDAEEISKKKKSWEVGKKWGEINGKGELHDRQIELIPDTFFLRRCRGVGGTIVTRYRENRRSAMLRPFLRNFLLSLLLKFGLLLSQ